MRTHHPVTLVDLAGALRQFADRVERLPLASHRSPEEPFVARQELARAMRRAAADATPAGQGPARLHGPPRPPARRRTRVGTHRIMVGRRVILVQHRRAAFAL